MQKKVLLPLMVLLGAGMSCDMNGTRPPTTGSIGIVLLAPSGARFASSRESGSATSGLEPIDALASVALTSARLIVTGPTSKIVTSSTAGPSGFVLKADGLTPGTYAVAVEGLANGQVAHFGTASGVTVTAGQETPANVTFPVFQPQIPNATVEDTSDVLRFTVTWNAVQNATSYIVEWSQSPTMANASSKNVSGATTTEVTVATEGKYYFTVRAVNPVVPAGGLASVAKSVFVFQGVATVSVSPPAPAINAGQTQQFTPEAKDGDGNVVPDVTWFWASSNHTVATVDQNGLVTGVGGGQATITAVGKGTPGSATVSVTGGAARLAFSTQPSSVTADDKVTAQVRVLDANGNVVSVAVPVTITFDFNAGGATLSGTRTVTSANGIADFTDLVADKVGTAYTLAARSGTLQPAFSGPFNVSPGAPNKLAFTITPTSSEPAAQLSAIEVAVQDQFGNATAAAIPVSVAIASNPGGATLGGTPVVASVNGKATFSDLSFNLPGIGYTLQASSTGLSSATSASIDVALEFATVQVGLFHACGLTVRGSAYCWGFGGSGQRGDGTITQSNVPVRVSGGHVFASLSVGAQHNCAIRQSDSVLLCWGEGSSGQIGNGGTSDALVPTAVSGSDVFSGVSAGSGHTCAIRTSDSRVMCWGNAGNGRLGNNLTTPNVLAPATTADAAAYSAVSAGNAHSCGIRSSDSRVLCWGAASNGRLGNGLTGPDVVAPAVTTNASAFIAVTAGNGHSCGIRSDQRLFCWGINNQGQLGNNDGTLAEQLSPGLVSGSLRASAVSAGSSQTCAVAISGEGFCWGAAGGGQLGNGSDAGNFLVPQAVVGGHSFLNISAGTNGSSCGATRDGGLCWGASGNGQAGNGSTSSASTPIRITGSR